MNEDLDEPLEELHKNGVTGNGGAIRSKRKGKEKDKHALVLEIPNDENESNLEALGEDAVAAEGEDEEEAGITRCICQKYGESPRVDHPGRVLRHPIRRRGERARRVHGAMRDVQGMAAWSVHAL